MKFSTFAALTSAIFVSGGAAQLSGTAVGPSTTTAHKAATKVCSVLDYGGVASKTSDVGPAIASAWAACKSGGQGESFCIMALGGMETDFEQFIFLREIMECRLGLLLLVELLFLSTWMGSSTALGKFYLTFHGVYLADARGL